MKKKRVRSHAYPRVIDFFNVSTIVWLVDGAVLVVWYPYCLFSYFCDVHSSTVNWDGDSLWYRTKCRNITDAYSI